MRVRVVAAATILARQIHAAQLQIAVSQIEAVLAQTQVVVTILA